LLIMMQDRMAIVSNVSKQPATTAYNYRYEGKIMENLKIAVKNVKTAEETLIREMKSYFKVGSTIEFKKGRGNIVGEILKVGRLFHPDIRIRSSTGKEYWVSLYDVTGLCEH